MLRGFAHHAAGAPSPGWSRRAFWSTATAPGPSCGASPPHVEQPLSRLTSFTEDMRLRGLVASSKDIERGVFLPTPEESMMLDIALSETVFRLSRLRLADGVPMAIERAAVPMRFLGGADRGRRFALRRARGRRAIARCARCSG